MMAPMTGRPGPHLLFIQSLRQSPFYFAVPLRRAPAGTSKIAGFSRPL